MELDQDSKRVERLVHLVRTRVAGDMLFPRPLERFPIRGIAEPQNEEQKGYVEKETSCSHSKVESPGPPSIT